MKVFSTAAFAAFLLAGASGLAVGAPAAAKDKTDAQAPGLKLTPAVRAQAVTAQTAIGANNLAAAEPAVAAAQAAATTNDDKYVASALRLDLETHKLAANSNGDETALVAPLQSLIANPSTPPADLPRFNYRLGAIAYNKKDYATALKYFTAAQQAGYTDPNLPLQMVTARVNSGDVKNGIAELQRVVDKMQANGQTPPEDYYKFAISKLNAAGDKAGAIDWLRKYVAAYPTPQNWRAVLYTFGMQQNSLVQLDKKQQIDVYRLLRQTHALADQYDYSKFADMLLSVGLPEEAKAVVAEGHASGKLPASSGATLVSVADKMMASGGSISSLEARAKASSDGKLAQQTGDGYLSKADYGKAAELYRVALQKGGVDAAEVNTRLGIALALSGDKAGAKTAFDAVTGAPRAEIASFWTTWLDHPASAG